jgi:hypothetical protein
MSPKNNSTTAAACPCSRLSRPRSTISQSDFHPVIRPFSPLRLGRSYKLAPEPGGSPLFTLLPLAACWRYEPREHLRPLAIDGAGCDSAFPFAGWGRLLRSRSISGLCSRIAVRTIRPNRAYGRSRDHPVPAQGRRTCQGLRPRRVRRLLAITRPPILPSVK